jgi:hypothetical protein
MSGICYLTIAKDKIFDLFDIKIKLMYKSYYFSLFFVLFDFKFFISLKEIGNFFITMKLLPIFSSILSIKDYIV